MERQLRWFIQLDGFYRILITVAVALGLVAVATGILEQSPVTFFLGMFWIVGGPGVVWVVTERGSE